MFLTLLQLGTALLLIYSAFAALYYAKATPIHANYDYDDYYFKKRALEENGSVFDGLITRNGLKNGLMFILDSINKKY